MDNNVYYDQQTKTLFTVKRTHKKSVVIGGCTLYFSDAKTSYMRYRISKDYLKKCIPIDTTSNLLFDDGIGLRLKDTKKFNIIENNPEFRYLSEETNKLVEHNIHYPPYSSDYFDELRG